MLGEAPFQAARNRRPIFSSGEWRDVGIAASADIDAVDLPNQFGVEQRSAQLARHIVQGNRTFTS
jgi:hypothetical protein